MATSGGYRGIGMEHASGGASPESPTIVYDNRTVYRVEGDLHIYRRTTHVNCSLTDDGNQQSSAAEEARKGVDAITFMPYKTLKLQVLQRIDEIPALLRKLKYLCKSDNYKECGVPCQTIDNVENGEQFLDVLEDCCLLSQRNVLYLQYLLQTATQHGQNCMDLCEEVKTYAEKYQEDFNTLYFQPVYKSKACGAFVTEFEIEYNIHGDTTHFANLDANGLTEVLSQKLGIPPRLVHIIGVKKGSVILAIQLPLFWHGEDTKRNLRRLVTEDTEFIVNFKIICVHIAKDVNCFVYKRQHVAVQGERDQSGSHSPKKGRASDRQQQIEQETRGGSKDGRQHAQGMPGTPEQDQQPEPESEQDQQPESPSTVNEVQIEDIPSTSAAADEVSISSSMIGKMSAVERRGKEFHDLRMDLLRQEHNYKIEIMQLDLNMKQEEHELKMEILRAIRDKESNHTSLSCSFAQLSNLAD
ncbi:uncharacterized protein [Amphiura filiformis]|uniref:uncharacterized protein n=1 Tax=Amphiura filiformis TaxID=82378 RepID=UPI003B224440